MYKYYDIICRVDTIHNNIICAGYDGKQIFEVLGDILVHIDHLFSCYCSIIIHFSPVV